MIGRDRARVVGLLALTATLHVVGMVRTPLPSQDGLKFIRIAREFGELPWADVVRRADQHPLYPALIALAHPAVAASVGEGPTSWRVAAQGVSALATIAMVVPFLAFAREVVGRRSAPLATFVFVLLPLSGRLGHETLSDATALLCAVGALALGTRAVRTGSVAALLGTGVIGGIGFLARPEVALVPGVVGLLVMGMGTSRRVAEAQRTRSVSCPLLRASATLREVRSRLLLASAVALPLLALVASYTGIKGTVSEKLSMRFATGLGEGSGLARDVPQWVPRGLDDPRWDFSPKEESDAPGRLGLLPAAGLVAKGVGEATGWVLVPLAAWGAFGQGPRRSRAARRLAAGLGAAFLVILVRHAMMAGYVSDRHCAVMAVVLAPFAASGLVRFGDRIGRRPALAPGRGRRLAIAGVALVAALGVGAQLKPGHPSRWGHREAGRWLAERAGPGEAVLDTRGWAAFVSGLRSYGPWHFRQALTDARLAFVVVGEDELTAGSRRAETLSAVLDFAAEPVAAFPSRQGGEAIGVRVFRFRRPASWEGIAR